MHYLFGVAVTLGVLAASCSGSDGPTASSQPVPATSASPGPPADPAETPCLSATPLFATRGTVSVLGGSRPDAGELSGIDWISTPACERIVLSFLTDQGAPASQIGLSRLEFAPEQGILRISMPRDVDRTGIADVVIEGLLADRAFVVRSRSGALSIDLHIRTEGPVEARGLIIGSPARLVIDLQSGPEDAAFRSAPPTMSDDIVVLSPPAGEAPYPLRIRGYARTLADVVTAEVSGEGPDVERRIVAADSQDAWGEFAVTISEGPIGEVSLRVATDRNAAGSTNTGVILSLTTR